MPDDAPARTGALALVLHSHMPYVEGFGTYPFGEEWLFDAVLRSYVPVLDVAERLTMSVTPVLADQLEADGVGERMIAFGRELRLEACLREAEESMAALRPACLAEADRHRAALAALERHGGDGLGLFREAQAERGVELVTSAATHAILPLLATDAAIRLQLDAGLRSHRRRFGESPGIWLPECAYAPGLERSLAEFGFEYFCVDQTPHHGPLEALEPIATGAGPVAFPIDWEAIEWVWSFEGYPSDPRHTDFNRQSLRGVRAWDIGGEPRDPEAGRERAREQGREFVAAVAERLAAHRERSGRDGVLVAAIDTELLGHWWWEGPYWLEAVIAEADAAGVELVTLGQAAELCEPRAGELRTASWGEHKDLSTWDSPPVADLAWGARRLELALLRRLAGRDLEPTRAERAARELLAVQASDWAFLDKRKQAGDYPFERVTNHAQALFEAIDSPESPAAKLRNLAPDLRLAPLLRP